MAMTTRDQAYYDAMRALAQVEEADLASPEAIEQARARVNSRYTGLLMGL